MKPLKLFSLLLLTPMSWLFSAGAAAQNIVCVDTNMGEFCMELLPEAAPGTVANFLNYVNDGDFDNTFIHRTVPNFVIQGGGFSTATVTQGQPVPVPQDPPIQNEFNVSNTRGTVAMARLGGQVNSATSEWFVNLTDNSPTLDFVDGGFTVFARIINDGMTVVDAIGNAPRVDLVSSLGAAFGEVPVSRATGDDGVDIDELVVVNRVFVADDVVIEEPPAPPPEDPDAPPPGPTEEDLIFACTDEWLQTLPPSNVCMDTNMGEFCLEMLPDAAPLTVRNFLHYVVDGDYDNTLFHRSVPGFVVQGGGFSFSPLGLRIPQDPPVMNEFNAPNTRGTVAMAKGAGDPNSATSEWFVNLVDNTATLGADNNGGFTAFARVLGDGMSLFDSIATFPTIDINNANPAFTQVPRKNPGTNLSIGDLVLVNRAWLVDAPPNPCAPPLPETVGSFASNRVSLPVRVGNSLLRVILNLQSTPPAFVFTVDLSRVITLADTGQEVAVFTPADNMLRVPSVRVGRKVFTNLELRRSNPDTFEFTLESFDPPAAAE
ncbi:MAG: peptidylprolyl isomerase [Pseudomonadales bacterium]|nr:peptidylprolyl isomerase [Pseudomonadales bacterium]